MSGQQVTRPLVLSDTPAEYNPRWIANMVDQLTRSFNFVIRKDQAVDKVLLLSPTGKVYKVTVSDLGVLSATEVPQGDRNA